MAEKSSNVIKALMKNGVMATINQNIDADTAEIIAQEFNHNVKIVGGSGVIDDVEDNCQVMGYPAVSLKEFVKKIKRK